MTKVEATPRKAMTDRRKREVLADYGLFCDVCHASLTTRVEYDHRIQLWLGGLEARENLHPLCIPCHKLKTAVDAKVRGKIKRILRREEEGPKPSKMKSRPMGKSQGFDKTRKRRMDGSVVKRTTR